MSTQKPVHRCINFIGALFVTDKTWKQPKCPAVSGRINCGIANQWNTIQCLKEMRAPSNHGKTWSKLKCKIPSKKKF